MKVTFPKGFFMRTVVIFCIAYIVFLTERSLQINQSVGAGVDGIYDVAVRFFGLELCMTMLKTITDGIRALIEAVKNGKKKQEDEEE